MAASVVIVGGRAHDDHCIVQVFEIACASWRWIGDGWIVRIRLLLSTEKRRYSRSSWLLEARSILLSNLSAPLPKANHSFTPGTVSDTSDDQSVVFSQIVGSLAMRFGEG